MDKNLIENKTRLKDIKKSAEKLEAETNKKDTVYKEAKR